MNGIIRQTDEELEDEAYFAHQFAEATRYLLEQPGSGTGRLESILSNFDQQIVCRQRDGVALRLLRECLSFVRGQLWRNSIRSQLLEKKIEHFLNQP